MSINKLWFYGISRNAPIRQNADNICKKREQDTTPAPQSLYNGQESPPV